MTFKFNPSTMPEPNSLLLPTRELVTPRRLDIAVKWRLFRHLHNGGDPDAERLYRWHLWERSGHRMQAGLATDHWKRGIDDYVRSAIGLAHSMAQRGFDGPSIPIDPDGELLDGSHRLGCALALGLESVPVEHKTRKVWAPAWDLAWFLSHGMSGEDLVRLQADYAALAASA